MLYHLYIAILSILFITTNIVNSEDAAVTRFREYLRINTAPPDPKYEESITWIKNQAEEIGLEFHRIDFPKPALFVIRLTWTGSNPNLKSIMLNSHIDVVPAEADKWIHDPFAAVKDANGDIYARGAQDRKSLGALYLETMRKLKASSYLPLRTIHITFVPDEELGGFRGMKPFVESKEFKELNVGLELDEGEYGTLTYGERSLWQFNVTAKGLPSHTLFMLPDKDNAGSKLLYVINKMFALRKKEMMELNNRRNNHNKTISDVTSINLSMIGGGTQANVVPSELWAVFDMRLRLKSYWQYADVEKFLNDTCSEAGADVSYKFINKNEISDETKLDESNQWWMTIKHFHEKMGKPLKAGILHASSDARFLRKEGIPALGYSTIEIKDFRMHQNNEYVNEKSYLNGINMFQSILEELASLPSDN